MLAEGKLFNTKLKESEWDFYLAEIWKWTIPSLDSDCLQPRQFNHSFNFSENGLEKKGIHAVLFKSKGIDIRAGCGMMAVRD